MRLWRLAKASRPHVSMEDEAEGAKRVGGRWNSKNTPIIYATYTIATAALEILVHIDWFAAPKHVLLAIDVPDDASIERIEIADLPKAWDFYPAPGILSSIGDDWIKDGTSLLLDVPSVASPYERNVLINPVHSDIARCKLSIEGPYEFDRRLKPD